ncbi:MAG TPA: dTMP kinase [Polyangiaceae bacterium]|nr:dTMP kinase [Polyangiaceae bacterium]
MIEGQFIVLEGIDGSGRSTQAALLGQWYRNQGLPVLVTREPSEGPIGAMIRQVLTHRLVVSGIAGPRAPTWATMALLFAADRLDHLDSLIVRNLMDGVTVISDRFDLSSIAYQSITSAAEVDPSVVEWVQTINGRARRPDLTIVLDVRPEIAARRREQRSYSTELYEDSVLQEALAKAYETAEAWVPRDLVVHIDGNPDEQTVHERIVAEVRRFRGDKR